jgi:uncharacterized protein YkwD
MALATKPKLPIQHKKMRGQHHHKSKQYVKTYWPYLPMLSIIACGFLFNSVWQRHAVLGAQSDFSSQSLLQDTNQQRAANHEPSLTDNPQLAAAAQAKANDMVRQNYWAHTSPSGKTPWNFIAASGYQYAVAGENLAYGFNNASDVLSGWMNSPEHRANILDNSYQNVGFGVASSPNFLDKGPTIIVVAEYAQPIADVANITFQVNNLEQYAAPVPPKTVTPNAQEPSAQLVSHLTVLSGRQATWLVASVSAITGAAVAFFILRHGLRLRRLLLEGEHFVVHHPFLEISLVFIATAGVVLSQTAGIIR